MSTVEMKAADLIGPALDWAVFCAVYRGMEPTIHVIEATTLERHPFIKPITFPRAVSLSYSGAYGVELYWHPSTDWECGGPLFDRYLLDFTVEHPKTIGSALCDENGMYISAMMFAETHLIAACRAIVRAKLGETVQIPAELANPA
ncbi:phage protein NinX family protein [Pseudomonas sp. C9-3]|uniref:phage protein NinX family protein n=1 Tax=Pseudomonas sp. C9-3 TaxID=3078264 RepID=UPI0028EFD650|nr:phage protein NinX family protein [Pseudomonas sp. C9-3]